MIEKSLLCPLCAHSFEMNLKKVEGAEKLKKIANVIRATNICQYIKFINTKSSLLSNANTIANDKLASKIGGLK